MRKNMLRAKPRTSVTGEATYTTTGSDTWVCPAGVFDVCVVCVGGGGRIVPGASSSALIGGGGAGLGWKNNIPVWPGQSYTLYVGDVGENTYFISTDTVAGLSPGISRIGGSYVGDGGGNGGYGAYGYFNPFPSTAGGGGGGAGGYSGTGGDGGNGVSGADDYNNGTAGTGGAGGGGRGATGPSSGHSRGGSGGGVGLLGQGASGAAGDGNPGSGGVERTYGGGSGGYYYGSTIAGKGAVRIIWGPNRAFPSTNTGVL